MPSESKALYTLVDPSSPPQMPGLAVGSPKESRKTQT